MELQRGLIDMMRIGFNAEGQPIPHEIDLLRQAKRYVDLQAFSLREAAEWLKSKTGKSISHVGLQKRFQNDSGLSSR